ncbi:MAG: PaaI family thioesterase [Porticoccaceae bacterium]
MELIRHAKDTGDFTLLSTGIPYMRTLGIEVRETGGVLTMTLRANRKLTGNPWLPALHGGVIGGLLETAAIIQLAHDQDSDKLPKTINITVEYLRSGRIEDLHARALVTKQGRRVANVQVQCWQADPDKPVATLHGHFLLGESKTQP